MYSGWDRRCILLATYHGPVYMHGMHVSGAAIYSNHRSISLLNMRCFDAFPPHTVLTCTALCPPPPPLDFSCATQKERFRGRHEA